MGEGSNSIFVYPGMVALRYGGLSGQLGKRGGRFGRCLDVLDDEVKVKET